MDEILMEHMGSLNEFDNILAIEDKVFNLSIFKVKHLLESAYSQLSISIMENTADYDLIEESFSDFAEKVHMAITRILDALKKFLTDLKIKIDAKIQQSGINKKLMDIKKALAEKKASLLEKCSYYDIQEYMSSYSKFIKEYTAAVKDGLNKDFKTDSEYNAWKNKMVEKMEQFKETLSNEEKWKLMRSVDTNLKYTEKEFQNRQRNLKVIEDIGNASLREIDEMSTKKFGFGISLKPHEVEIQKRKRSFIGYICSQIAMCVRTVAKFVSKHVFLCLTAIVIAIVA